MFQSVYYNMYTIIRTHSSMIRCNDIEHYIRSLTYLDLCPTFAYVYSLIYNNIESILL